MDKKLILLLVILACAFAAHAQTFPTAPLNGPGPPVNPCSNGVLYTDTNNGNLWSCKAGAWNNDNVKAPAATAIQYVAGTCSGGVACVDTNDGLSWATAKFTIYTALCSLPRPGNCSTQNAGGGTVFVGNGAIANPTNTAGIWIMGSNDPNFGSPPAGWLKCDVGCTTTIIGVPNINQGANPHKGRVAVLTGNKGAKNDGGVWISAPWGPVDIENLSIEAPSSFPYGRAFVIGECSNNTRASTCATASVTLVNDAGASRQHPGFGPCADITGGSFWIYLQDMSCSGNVVASGSSTADKSAAILIDGKTNVGNGLVYITNTNLANGGIKFNPGSSGGSFSSPT